eukprot:GHVP01031778.1.p1 GENE.GHVP01031778.1~~GHVP01031778.1.p1  ORF type:complete len:119 (+),score=0.92 GHVP01031778.1:1441-1797(+)
MCNEREMRKDDYEIPKLGEKTLVFLSSRNAVYEYVDDLRTRLKTAHVIAHTSETAQRKDVIDAMPLPGSSRYKNSDTVVVVATTTCASRRRRCNGLRYGLPVVNNIVSWSRYSCRWHV